MKLRSVACLVSTLAGFAMSSTVFAAGYDVTIGAGVDLAPRYLGSNQYHFIPVPYLNVTTPSGIYIDTTRGAGYQLHLPHDFYVDGAVNYAIGRKDSDESFGSGSDALRGMGNVPNALVATIAAGYRFAGAGSVSVAGDIPLTNRGVGDSWRAALEVPLMMTTADVVTTKAVAHIGSANYNRTMWGVNASQSAASGFRQYSLGGGFNAVDFGLTWTHLIDRHWSVSTSGQVTRLVGNAAASPIVARRTSLNVATIVGYRF
ncbi:structural protein MipA [Burkholderia lata]|uniref:Structural protein MipA n=1 Tax=Burkholderia lata (strain ATCC 17760 / DSM 23089 / LMG 22485 / NCIMB 9086 / R18194 / 383) TaxID=482957 RepID=A0A6P2YG40_BURL3|nr:MipA/OmpV family protein [Burkholderia lata]VWD21242.1 structural protein MipA [Burkholderia lata]